MPELPEVETIRLQLAKKLPGLKITNFTHDHPNKLYGDAKEIIGQTISNLRRFAKILVIDFKSGKSLLIHLKMTGQLIYQKGNDRIAGGHPVPPLNLAVPNSTTRAVFDFDNGGKLYFNDLRKFGWIKVVDTKGEEIEKLDKEYGIEPLDKRFTLKYFNQKLAKVKNRPVKIAIMDQNIVPGVGNIYAAEALWFAKILPSRKVNSLSEAEVKALYEGIELSIKTGIKYGGASNTSYVKPDGELGVYLKYANVYNRKGEKCKRCGAIIQKEMLGQRGTYYCAKCQK